MSQVNELRKGFEAAFVDGNVAADYRYKPAFVSNNPEEGKKVIASIEDELLACDKFQISVAFITHGWNHAIASDVKGIGE